jgi:hypothetical protein
MLRIGYIDENFKLIFVISPQDGVWAGDSYDRVVRDGAEFGRVLAERKSLWQYIECNPSSGGRARWAPPHDRIGLD